MIHTGPCSVRGLALHGWAPGGKPHYFSVFMFSISKMGITPAAQSLCYRWPSQRPSPVMSCVGSEPVQRTSGVSQKSAAPKLFASPVRIIGGPESVSAKSHGNSYLVVTLRKIIHSKNREVEADSVSSGHSHVRL